MNDARVQVLLSVFILDKEEDISLEGSVFVFGRSSKSDVYIDDPCMSRSHFQIFTKSDGKSNELWIADLGSANGTYINNVEVEANSTARIHPGDVLTIESSTTQIVIKQIKFLNQPVVIINDQEDISSIMNKIIEDANAKADEILASANKVARKAGRLAKEQAIAEFSDDIKAQLHAEEKLKVQTQSTLEFKAIQDEHTKQKAELLSSLVGLDTDLASKQQELSTLSIDVEIKKQKILEDLDREHSESMNTFTELKAKMAADVARVKQEIAKLEEFHETKREYQRKVIEVEVENRKNELQAEVLEYDQKLSTSKKELDREHSENMNSLKESGVLLAADLARVKQEIGKLEKLHQSKREEQLKVIEIEVENRKNELQAEVLEYDQKLTSSKKEFAKLYDTYEFKKTEQTDVVNELLKTKESLVTEIKKLEGLVSESKNTCEQESEKQNILAAYFLELAAEKTSVEKNIAGLKLENSNEKKLIDDKFQELQLLNLDLENIKKNKEDQLSEIETLNEQARQLKSKIDISSIQAANIDTGHKQRINDLEKTHLEAKKNYQDEMVKLKESVEKRLQLQLQDESARISKLKEESLRLVIDLEDSITKEISIATSHLFTSSIGASKYSEIAAQFEKSIRTSLQTGVLKLLKNDVNTASKNTGLASSRQDWKPLAVGFVLSAVIFVLLPYVYKEILFHNDPVQQQLRLEAERATRALIPIAKFTPEKVATLGASFVLSVNHTEEFCETYALPEFRAKLIKEGSVYLYKSWQIDEEKSIESYAIMFSLIDALKLRRDSVKPEFEKRDVAKMAVLEHETMKKVEILLGNGVRLEAALKFQARFYNDFVAERGVASGVKE